MPVLLVIDDEESVRYSFRYVYEDEVQVLTAGTAAEGWQLLQEQEPDVVVLDLQLPDRPGLDLFQDVRALDTQRPVIFITAHGTAGTAIEAMKQGAFDYLVKPAALQRHHGKPVPGLRPATADRPGRGGAAVRESNDLGRRAAVPARLGADPPARAPVGPSETRADRAQTRCKNRDLRRVMNKAVTHRVGVGALAGASGWGPPPHRAQRRECTRRVGGPLHGGP
jgi:CheY-like chemotaxis protein